MVIIPQHVERYLEDLKFTATEVVVLKKLLEGTPCTLREIAAKTGKSTGVLDQAVRKLLQKRIVTRMVHNQTPKYAVESSEALLEWVRRDLEEKWSHWHRRGKDFELFLRSMEGCGERPTIRHYDGCEGIDRLRIELAESNEDQFTFLPPASLAALVDNRDENKRFAVLRRKNGTRMRILTLDSPVARKFAAEDQLFCRKTMLCPDSSYEFSCEKIVTGDRIACIDADSLRATVVTHAVLAKTERASFEVLWRLMCEKRDSVLNVSQTHRVTSVERPESQIGRFSRWYAEVLPDVPHWMYGIMVSLRILPRTQRRTTSDDVCALRIHALDRKGMVSDIAGLFAKHDVNLIRFRIYAVPPGSSVYDVRFEARNREEAMPLIEELHRIADVLSIKRKAPVRRSPRWYDAIALPRTSWRSSMTIRRFSPSAILCPLSACPQPTA